MSALGWCLLTGVGWSHAGYPLACSVVGRMRPFRERVPLDWKPSVSIVVAATNEEAHIEEKLRSSLQTMVGGPLEVICAANGCTDATATLARRVPDDRIRVIEITVRGKSAAQNAALEVARGDVVVFTDANTDVAVGAVDRLVRPLGDDRIEVSQGQILLYGGDRGQQAESWYWRYESWLRQEESRLGRAVCASGGLMAVRRNDYSPLPVDEMEDIVLPVRALSRNRRSVVVEDAAAREPLRGGRSASRDAHRRIALQDSRAVLGWMIRSGYRSPTLAFQLLSRKVLRWAAMPMAVLAMIDLSGEAFRGGWPAMVVCIIGLTAVLLGCLGDRAGRVGRACRHAGLIHVAASQGLAAMLFGARMSGWQSGRLASAEWETR